MSDNFSDNDSDLDMDIVELSRRSCPQSSSAVGVGTDLPVEVTLDEGNDVGGSSIVDNDDTHYGLRRGRTRVNYKNMSQNSDDDEVHPTSSSKKPKKSKPRDVLEWSPLLKRNPISIKQLNKYLKNPESIENLSKWNINMQEIQMNNLVDPPHFELVKKFVTKCARYVDELRLICDPECIKPPPYWVKVLELLSIIFKNATFVKTFSMKYHKEEGNGEQVVEVLQVITDSGQKSLNSLKLLSLIGGTYAGVITERELDLVVDLEEEGDIRWKEIELGDGLLVADDFRIVKCLERLLGSSKSSLETLTVHGGFKAHPNIYDDKWKLKITFPRTMANLTELTICPKYDFVSDIPNCRNPVSKRWREIRLDEDVRVVGGEIELNPVKITLSLGHSDFPKLEKVILGNLVDLEECGYALLRKLKVFRCGSRWDLAIRYPQSGSKKCPSELMELQLPDGLKDPSFVQNVGKFFPFLKKVWIYLPSVAVLRTFFKCYGTSSTLEELYLKTQFDFETTMESCLLPQLRMDKNSLSASSRTVLATLKQYKHFGDYVRYHNIELPLEDEEDLAELSTRGSGIRALKSLKVLDLEHIPRVVLIPNPDDERRWYDHNFKYLNTTFGFEKYPFSERCHREILAMNLNEYHWRNLDLIGSVTKQFSRAGYVAIDTVDLMSSDGSDDDLFIPVDVSRKQKNKRGTSKGVKVAIKPSMLIQNHFNKDKSET